MKCVRFLAALVLPCVLVLVVLAIPTSAQETTKASSPAANARAKASVQKAFQQQKAVKVVLTDKRKLEGRVSNVTDDGFAIDDKKTGRSEQVSFADVQEAKRVGMGAKKKWAIAGGVIGGVVIAAVAVGEQID